MHPAFTSAHYTIKPHGFSLGGKFRLIDSNDREVLFSEQKNRWSSPFTTIRVFADDKKTHQVLQIEDSPSAAAANSFDVTDSASGQKLGSLAGEWGNWFADAWSIADAQGSTIAQIRESSTGRAALRELVSSLIPQVLYIYSGEVQVAELRQKNAVIGHHLLVDLSMDTGTLDRRLVLAAALLIAGHQQSEAE